jgi:SAM-dependent methyltransferase
MQPLANKLLSPDVPVQAEAMHPLRPMVCGECFLVQLPEIESPQTIFSDYTYFSSYSDTWLDHVAQYAERMIARLHLTATSRVIEVASNDGHLLQCFKARGMTVLGVEPAANVAKVAENAGIPTLARFFGQTLAEELRDGGEGADLLVANNVIAHVPELHDFVAGMRTILHPAGVASIEFPHVMRLIQGTQYDTIYHEHFSYLSFAVVEAVLREHGLVIFDVEELPTHGGSLRLYMRHQFASGPSPTAAVEQVRTMESAFGMGRLETYLGFEEDVRASRTALLEMLHATRQDTGQVAAYGAPAKATTLLNYCKIGPELIDYTVDRSPHKQGLLIPGVRVPIRSPKQLRDTQPKCVVILAWNIAEEIMRQIGYVREWGGRFMVPIPRARVVQ